MPLPKGRRAEKKVGWVLSSIAQERSEVGLALNVQIAVNEAARALYLRVKLCYVWGYETKATHAIESAARKLSPQEDNSYEIF